VEGETGFCGETCVMCDVDGSEEICIKNEEAIDIKDEITEEIMYPSIRIEHEVRQS
jgi:hypothetical protein